MPEMSLSLCAILRAAKNADVAAAEPVYHAQGRCHDHRQPSRKTSINDCMLF